MWVHTFLSSAISKWFCFQIVSTTVIHFLCEKFAYEMKTRVKKSLIRVLRVYIFTFQWINAWNEENTFGKDEESCRAIICFSLKSNIIRLMRILRDLSAKMQTSTFLFFVVIWKSRKEMEIHAHTCFLVHSIWVRSCASFMYDVATSLFRSEVWYRKRKKNRLRESGCLLT